MRRFLLYLFVFIVVELLSIGARQLYAQHLIPLDELSYLRDVEETIQGSSDDSLRTHNYLLLSAYWSTIDRVKSTQAMEKARAELPKESFPKGIFAYYEAYYHHQLGQNKDALTHYTEAIALLKDDTAAASQQLLASAWYNLAYMQVSDKGYDFMVEILTQHCIPISAAHQDTAAQAFYYTQMGLTFMSVGQFDKADAQHAKALTFLNDIDHEDVVHLHTYFNLISNYCYMPDSKSAKVYLDKASALISRYPSSRHLPNYYFQQGMYYTTITDYPGALHALHQGVHHATQQQQPKILQLLKFRIYNVYLMQKEYAQAKSLLAGILQDNILLNEGLNKKIVYSQLAYVNELLGDYASAYGWANKASAVNDSLQQAKLLEKMQELELVHQSVDKQQTIDRLEHEKIEQQLLVKTKHMRTLMLIFALVMVLLIAFFIYISFRNQKNLNRQIHKNHQQELSQIDRERKYEAAQSILKGEEQERQRIAQDLHDSMGGILANMRMNISSQPSSTTNTALIKKIDHSIAEMRRISRNLMPETLKNISLEVALQELCETMSLPSLAIQFESFGVSTTLPFPTQINLYRICQESISNTIKHAQASHVIVQISQHQQHIQLTIEDDGIGFSPEAITYGMGLKNIENRSQLINGTFALSSKKGEGTTLNIECYV